jgi:dolichyl-diphosphooligosaccharide--protein glycosyltransferase
VVSTFDGEGLAYWSFDEGEGSRAYDRSGGYHATLMNATWREGMSGAAVSLNSSESSSVGIGQFEGPREAFSVSLWVNPTSLDTTGANDYRQLVRPAIGNLLILTENGGVSFRVPGVETANFVAGSVPTGEWTHIVATYDGSTRRIYVDGQLIAKETVGGGTVAWGESLRLGRGSTDAHAFRGGIDEVRVYGRALSPAEVRELAEDG